VRAAHGRAREAKTHLVHSATCSCSIELYKQWYPLADFFAKLEFSRGFLFVCRISEAAMVGEEQRSCDWPGGARSAPLGVLMSRKRWGRAAHGRAREAKTH